MNKNKEFIKNTIILFIGKFATQFMSLLLLPLYTHYLLKNDYGTVDLLQTYISLFIPVLTLRIDSATFRFLIDKREQKVEIKKILSNILFILFVVTLLTFIIGVVIGLFVEIQYYLYVLGNIIIMMCSSIMLQILRGLGKNKNYSIASIITAFITLISNFILIVVFKLNASSILISSLIANFVCIFYVCLNINMFKYISILKVNKKTIKEILTYSLPMIPNSLSWWIVNVSDRTIISIFLGVSSNAIYTVACKFSNILNSVFSIISMSWQETATLHINDSDRDKFFSNIINQILILFSCVGLLILVFLSIFYNFVIGDNYISSYNYIPLLIYANTWNVLIGLIGGIYIAKKKTKEIANTTIISAILNIVINFVLIKFIGLYAACISTLLSYMIMSIYRYFDCQKYVKLKLNFKQIILFTIIFIISSFIYLKNNIILQIFNLLFVIIYSIIINKQMILSFINMFLDKIKRVKKDKNVKSIEDNELVRVEEEPILSSDSYINNDTPILDKDLIPEEVYRDRESLSRAIRNDSSYIRYIDFNYRYDFDIVDLILEESKIYSYVFHNEDYLRNNKYPTILSNNHTFVKYVIDKDFNNIFYVDTRCMSDEEVRGLINYTFRKVYYLREDNRGINFNINKFSYSDIMNDSYFQECLKYLR